MNLFFNNLEPLYQSCILHIISDYIMLL